jgi:hypothetical protein
VSLGIFTLDAEGNLLDGKATASLNGTVTDEVFSGTYSVNPDCTGKLTINVLDPSGNKLFTGTLDLVFDEDAHEMRAMYTSAVTPTGVALAPVIAVEAKRIAEPKQQSVIAGYPGEIAPMVNSSLPNSLSALPASTSTVTVPTVQLPQAMLFRLPEPGPFPPKCSGPSVNPETMTLTNLGPGVLNMGDIYISGPFSETNTCRGSLGAGQSCNITVTWQKIVSPGRLSIYDNGAGSPQHVLLEGVIGCPFW